MQEVHNLILLSLLKQSLGVVENASSNYKNGITAGILGKTFDSMGSKLNSTHIPFSFLQTHLFLWGQRSGEEF